MAQKVQVLLVDDIDGGAADETIEFGVDGATYEIDLNTANATKLRELVGPFVESARKVTAKRGPARGAKRTTLSRDESSDIRTWARNQGKQINDRGRIPQTIVEEYRAAQR